MNVHFQLSHAVTEYDRRRQGKRGYNVYALARYLGAVNEVEDAVRAGKSLRAALVANFNGRLLDVCLKAVGEAGSTSLEQRGL